MAQDAAAEPLQRSRQRSRCRGSRAAEAKSRPPNFSWNLGVTSDYVFRGITQTDFDPALQGGLDYAFGDSGWYVGAWASNVDFADPDGPGPRARHLRSATARI